MGNILFLNWFGEYIDLSFETTSKLGVDRIFVERKRAERLTKLYSDLRKITVREIPGILSYESELTDEELTRRRFRYEVSTEFLKLGPRWGPAFSFYFSKLKRIVSRKHLARFKRLLDLETATSSSILYDRLKMLTDFYKKNGDWYSPRYWKYFVNLETFGGYLNNVEDELFDSEIAQWISGDITHTFADGDEDRWLSDFRLGVREFLRFKNPNYRPDDNPPWDDWIRRPILWATSGSTSDKLPRKWSKLRVGYVQQNKQSYAWYNNPDKLTEAVKSATISYNKVIQKREPGKVRPVVNSDNVTYLVMAKLARAIEGRLRGHPLSPLYRGNIATSDWNARWVQDVSRTSLFHMPLDQSHFDWQVNMRMLDIMVDELETYCQGVDYEPWLWKKVRTLLHNGVVTTGSGQRFKHTKGVLSGWRWTSLLDTLANFGELYAADKEIRRNLVTTPTSRLTSIAVQGDDDQITSSDGWYCAVVAWMYKVMNLEINPAKFWISASRDEFLRKVVERNNTHISGYPARGVNGLFWSNPVNLDPIAGPDRANSIVDQWNTLISRGIPASIVKDDLIDDVSNGTKVSREVIREWLSTPVNLGGAGLFSATKILTALDGGNLSNSEEPPKGIVNGRVYLTYLRPKQIVDIVKSTLDYTRGAMITSDFKITHPTDRKVVQLFYGPRLRRSEKLPTTELITDLTMYVTTEQLLEVMDRYPLTRNNRQMQLRLSRSLFTDWLLGVIDYRTPRLAGIDRGLVAMWFKDRVDSAIGGVVKVREKLGYNTVRTIQTEIEKLITKEKILDKYGYTISG
jgi:hypothetical protein